MRATRAYLAGFGTAGSLLAGAALLFVLATAYVSFAGWPKIGDAPGPSSVVVTPAADSQGQANGRLAVIAARNGGLLPGLATVGGPSGGLAIVGSAARGVGLNLGIGGSGRQQSVSGGGKTGGPVGSGGGGGGGTGGCIGSQCVITPPGTPGVPTGPAQNIVQQTEQTVTGAANSVGSTAQGVVRRITKGAGSPATGGTGGTINGATHSVGGAVGGATGSVGGATGSVGGATGSVGGATGGLGGLGH